MAIFSRSLLNAINCKQLYLLIQTFILTAFFAKLIAQQSGNESYLIKGFINGMDSGIVRMHSSDFSKISDSAIIRNGQFYMQGKISSPEQRIFMISPGNLSFRAFVENNIIQVNADTAGAVHYGSGSNAWTLLETKQTGSQLADVYSQYQNETGLKYYLSIILTFRNEIKIGNISPNEKTIINGKLDSVAGVLMQRQKNWIENFIVAQPASIAGVFIFNDFFENYKYFLSDAESYSYLYSNLQKFSGVAKTSLYYKQLNEKLTQLSHIKIGSLAPDFTLLQRTKAKFTLSSTKGNYVLIDFWASWCIPCRQAIPSWKKLFLTLKDKGFTMVSVADDRELKDWIKALEKEQMPWIQVIDEFQDEYSPARVCNLFGVDTLPFYVLLDKEGKVIIASKDQSAVKKAIEELFK